MTVNKAPDGALFPYYYKGGELFGAHFGSFFKDEERLLELMQAEEQFIAQAHHPLPVWIDFYETTLSERVLTGFLQSMQRLRPFITRLAIVGCSRWDRWRLGRLVKNGSIELPLPLRYFDDPEEAKTWLVSERG